MASTISSFGPLAASTAARGAWKAGVATIDITPALGIWMGGFAARTAASSGVESLLYAKALALEDATGDAAVLVSIELLGITERTANRVADVVRRRHGLPRARLLLSTTHTHCGPVTDDLLPIAYDLTPEQHAVVHAYTQELESKLTTVIAEALSRRQPARLTCGESEATFAMNRRTHFPGGPVDHVVPVLRVDVMTRDFDAREPLAIVFGYACHTTTLTPDYTRIHGDYAGAAQMRLEERHPGTTALFVTGCGGDANPRERGTLALAEEYGTALADAVDRVLPSLVPVSGPLGAAYEIVDLPFEPAPGRDVWIVRLDDEDQYVRRHAALMLEILDREGRLPAVQPDPIQVWRFGTDLTLIAMGGEVVADYVGVLRADHAHDAGRLWIAAYCNDVFGYVPSRRVLREGGYEADRSMLYYARPGRFTPQVEELVRDTVRDAMRAARPVRR